MNLVCGDASRMEYGSGYFDLVTQAVSPDASTLALRGSTEEAQFTEQAPFTA